MVDYTIFSELLQKKRLKPIDVSRATGISTGNLSDWKSGRAYPKIDKLQKIADYLNVPVNYLLGIEENADPKINEIVKLATSLSPKQQDALIAFIKTLLAD